MATEACNNLDLVLDVRKPHLDWVQDMLGLFRSATIWSNGLYKVITERQDLPVRQVFQAGNIVGRPEVRIGGDPTRPNRVIATFANRDLDYAQDLKYVSDITLTQSDHSLSPVELSFIGITRETEVLRASGMELQRRRQTRREISWTTNLEALAVEPGDVAVVGVPMTNWEMGYGGRALDGSLTHILLDREVVVKSGFAHELWVWHTEADTPEVRTVATTVSGGVSSLTALVLAPVAAFSYTVVAGDRWAMGISSEDLTRVRITRVSRSEGGLHQLSGEEFIPFDSIMDCPGSVTTAVSNAAPSQPSTASFAINDPCNLCVNVVTVPASVGDILPVPGSITNITIGSSHNPNPDALNDDTIVFTTGPASGESREITAWTGSGTDIVTVASVSAPSSGDAYYIQHRVPLFAGLEVEIDSGGGFGFLGIIYNTSGCLSVRDTADEFGARITPFSNRGQRNTAGRWTASLAALGCRDFNTPFTDPTTSTGSATSILYNTNIIGGLLGTTTRITADINALMTDVCSPANERTDLSLGLEYGGQTLVESLIIRTNDTGAYGTQHRYGHGFYGGTNQAGSERAVRIEARLTADGATDRQIGLLRYEGINEVAQVPLNIAKTGTGTVDSTLTHTLAVTARFRHVDSASAVHSHGCHFLVFRSAVTLVETF